jgi:hypothetical protein
VTDPSSDRSAAPPRRLRREARTVEVMIRMYCRADHPSSGTPAANAGAPAADDATPAAGEGTPAHARGHALCPDCDALLSYSLERIAACRFGAAKPTCARCTVHCFRPAMRERVRAAMRHSGPRMTYRHPYLAVRHVMDRRREPALDR